MLCRVGSRIQNPWLLISDQCCLSIPCMFWSTLAFVLWDTILWIAFRSITASAYNFPCLWVILLRDWHICPCFSPVCICFLSLTLLSVACMRSKHIVFVLILCRLDLFIFLLGPYVLQMTVHRLGSVKDRLVNTSSHWIHWNLDLNIRRTFQCPVHYLLLEFLCLTYHRKVVSLARLRVMFRKTKWLSHLILLAMFRRSCWTLS